MALAGWAGTSTELRVMYTGSIQQRSCVTRGDSVIGLGKDDTPFSVHSSFFFFSREDFWRMEMQKVTRCLRHSKKVNSTELRCVWMWIRGKKTKQKQKRWLR